MSIKVVAASNGEKIIPSKSPSDRHAETDSAQSWITILGKRLVRDYTIEHALDPERLALERTKYQKLSLQEQMKLGAQVGVLAFVQAMLFVIVSGIFCRMMGMHEGDPATKKPSFVGAVCVAPVAEEVIFRGGIQQGLSYILNSSTTIMLSNSLFAAVHLSNTGKTVSSLNAKRLALRCFLFPAFGILYYTTGGLAAPIAAHTVNNVMVAALCKFMKSIKRR